ncbi:hypothetical protein ACFXJ8_00685 [Nonomuraea sp. NPDC059194]|uniref:hypothetical protein n=1 Tax=Nonomuraea sp. NPDC059194 TaxID=3346764 RepID=UPI0036BEDCD7
MVGLFVKLKIRLIAGGMRGDTQRILGFAFSLIAALAVALGGFLLLALLRAAPPQVAADVGVIAYTGLLVCWATVPLLAFGLDDTLDPSRLSLFPLRTRQLATGMFAAAVTGVWPTVSLIVTAGVLVGLARGAGGFLLGVVAVALQFALCIVTSRLITTALSGLLRSRRGRDLLAVAVIVFVLLAQLPNLIINRGLTGDPLAMLHSLASVLRWTPSGWAAHAIADGGLTGALELAALALLVLALGWLWIKALGRALVTPDASTQAASVRRSSGLLDRLLPDGRVAAVVSKELKYARRDPRGRIGWFASLAVTGVLAFSINGDGSAGGAAAAIGPACVGALMIGMQQCNTFGIDGRSLWMNAVVYGDSRDLRSDLAGRHLAVAIIAVPVLVVLGVIGGLFAGSLAWVLPAVLTAWGVLGVGLGVGAVTSVLVPYTVPDRLNAFTGAAPGQGGVAFVASFGAVIATAVLALPVALPVLLGVGWMSVVALPYGLTMAWAGRLLAGRVGASRMPELVAAVSRPT